MVNQLDKKLNYIQQLIKISIICIVISLIHHKTNFNHLNYPFLDIYLYQPYQLLSVIEVKKFYDNNQNLLFNLKLLHNLVIYLTISLIIVFLDNFTLYITLIFTSYLLNLMIYSIISNSQIILIKHLLLYINIILNQKVFLNIPISNRENFFHQQFLNLSYSVLYSYQYQNLIQPY